MGNTFKPITDKETSRINLGKICVGISGMQGHREEMEDGHINEVIDGDHLFLGVFDGHGGKACAEYVCGMKNPDTGLNLIEESKCLVQVLKETDEWKRYVREGKTNIELLQDAIKTAFIEMDKQERLLHFELNNNHYRLIFNIKEEPETRKKLIMHPHLVIEFNN